MLAVSKVALIKYEPPCHSKEAYEIYFAIQIALHVHSMVADQSSPTIFERSVHRISESTPSMIVSNENVNNSSVVSLQGIAKFIERVDDRKG
jgi:hypothetical protein